MERYVNVKELEDQIILITNLLAVLAGQARMIADKNSKWKSDLVKIENLTLKIIDEFKILQSGCA